MVLFMPMKNKVFYMPMKNTYPRYTNIPTLVIYPNFLSLLVSWTCMPD